MTSEKQFSALLQVLAGEQQVIQRTDQKAFTLLSVLGVFMVFFIVHFPKLSSNMNLSIFILNHFSNKKHSIFLAFFNAKAYLFDCNFRF